MGKCDVKNCTQINCTHIRIRKIVSNLTKKHHAPQKEGGNIIINIIIIPFSQIYFSFLSISVPKYTNATLKIIYSELGAESDHERTPKRLTNYNSFRNQVRYKKPQISGWTNPKAVENVLHSKLFISDRY